jgi:hypothetical protein
MDYLSISAFITPAWIILGALGVLFTQRLLWPYLAVCVLLALVSWLSGVAQIREQRSFDERQQAVQAHQQELSAKFEKLAISLGMPANSPHEMIMNRMQAINFKPARSSGCDERITGSKEVQ